MVTDLLEAEGQTITPLLLDKIASYYNFHKREDFFLAVGNRSIELPESFRKVFQGADGNFFSRLFRPSKKNRELTAATIEEAQSPDKPNTKKALPSRTTPPHPQLHHSPLLLSYSGR